MSLVTVVLGVACHQFPEESAGPLSDRSAAAADGGGLESADAAGGNADSGVNLANTLDAGAAGEIVPYTMALGPGEWAGMDSAARSQFMRDMVLPSMRPLFQEFDAVKFASVKCTTCHGANARDNGYAMPTADLPALDSQALMSPDESSKLMIDFMRGTVKPRMAELLGMQDESPGFRCNNCHMQSP